MSSDDDKFYYVYLLVGAFSCGLSHALLTPFELLKVRKHSHSRKYAHKSVIQALKIMYKEGGLANLYYGWTPIMIGYTLQGGVKFICYEYLKFVYRPIIEHRILSYTAAAGTAEFVADIFLAPFEATKVRMHSFDTRKTMRHSMEHIYKKEGLTGFYGGIIIIWCRQIPYTMIKISTFEKTNEYLYVHIMKKPRLDCEMKEKLLVSCMASYVSAILTSIISNPADYFISRYYRDSKVTVKSIIEDTDFFDLWSGLLLRIFIGGTISFLVILIRYLHKARVFHKAARPLREKLYPSAFNS